MTDQNNDKDKNIILDDEKNLVLDHDYDGIQELDHPLPSWWITIFVLTVIFSIPYYFYYNHFGGADGADELAEKMKDIKTRQAQYQAQKGGLDLDAYNAYVSTDLAKKKGRKVYRRKCMSCHADQGQGLIGPNLTDHYWIHGKGDLASIYKVVDEGIAEKGMPAWGKTLKEKELWAVVQYVLEMKGKNIQGKEPQGEEVN